jgi:UDP-glucuronate decarboxylase
MYGDGSQTRSFCYVDDLIEGFVRLMASDKEITGPVNLGNPREFTIRQLASQVLEIVGADTNLIEAPLPEDDPKQRKPDISLARSVLGWEPSIHLEEGLRQTIDYFRQKV